MVIEKDKKCSKCGEWKNKLKEFYLNKGFIRPSCKECFKKQTAACAKKNRALRKELGLNDNYNKDRLAYQRAYYHNNRSKYTNYRQKFVQSHPDYYKMYYRAKRDNIHSHTQRDNISQPKDILSQPRDILSLNAVKRF